MRTPLNRRWIPGHIRDFCYHSMQQHAKVPFARIDRAYRRWRTGYKPERCKYGVRDQAIAVDCNCDGCVEKLLMLWWDWVALKFAPEPGDPVAPVGPPT